MKSARRLLTIPSFVITACCALLLSIASLAQAAADTLRVASLKDKVTVQRDERGIPYIEASNDHDLYFAQGYVTTSDRLWQMNVLRRTAN